MSSSFNTISSSFFTQIGSNIAGEAAGDYSGWSVSLSADGSVVAIGAQDNDGNGNGSGHVRIYQNVNNTWTQVGSDIDGEATNDNSGGSVSLSADGSIVAIGATDNDGNGVNSDSGHVRIYKNVNDTWTKVGGDIDGVSNSYSGKSVSLSSDGSVVAIGATGKDGNGIDSGHVRIYKNVNDTWTKVGGDIDGEAAFDYSGQSVSLSSDGSVVAIGAPLNDGNGDGSGHVRIYKNVNDTWTKVGGDIDGESSYDNSGSSVSLSSDGSIVAIGAPNNIANGYSGHVRIYKNVNNIWTQVGSDIDGEANGDDSGKSVSLSSDGSIVAIGAPDNDGNGNNSGHVRIYQNINNTWNKVIEDIDGEASGDQSGYSVSLSSDGTIVSIGAPNNDGNGGDSGHVRVYQIHSITLETQTISASELISLDAQYSGTVNASSVNTITGSAADVNSVYASSTTSSQTTLTDLEALQYIASNPDLISAFGIDTSAAAAHYINHGKSEGRSLTSFSASDYLAKYSDLASVFGNDETLALQHYILRGYAEGRTVTSSTGITGLGNEAVTITDTSIAASVLNTLDGNTSGIVDAGTVTTLTGSAADINTAYSSNGISNLGNAAVNLSGANTVSQINSVGLSMFLANTITPGLLTATISDNDVDTLSGISDSGNALTITVTDASVDASALTALDEKTSVAVSVSSTTLKGTAAEVFAIYIANTSGTITGLGNEAVTISDTSIDASVLIALDELTTGIIDASSITTLTGSDSDKATVKGSNGIIGLPGNLLKIGSDIDGEAADDYSGTSVGLSSDGSVVAIGAIYNDGNGDLSGHVRIYKNINNTWTKIGSDIDGEATGDESGKSVSISSDGSIVAIGAPDNDGNGTNSGHVRVYQNVNNIWTQVGSDIDGEGENDKSGYSVSLSSDGSVVAIGAPHNYVNGNETGHVRIYKNVNNIWTQFDSDIDGEANNDRAGGSVSLSTDGSVLAIGSRLNDGNGTNSGHVRLYSIVDTTATTLSDLEALKYIASNPDLISAFGIDTSAAAPPIFNIELLLAPEPDVPITAVLISAASDQEVPFHCSCVSLPLEGGFPPKIAADVCEPADPNSSLAVLRSLTSVHDVPFQDSVAALFPGFPPITIPAGSVRPAPLN